MPAESGPPLLAAGVSVFLAICIFWFIVVPFLMDGIEWIFNIGGRRRP